MLCSYDVNLDDFLNLSSVSLLHNFDDLILAWPVGTSDIEKQDALCILPLNIVNEKIYIFIWFWLLLLGKVSSQFPVSDHQDQIYVLKRLKLLFSLKITSKNDMLFSPQAQWNFFLFFFPHCCCRDLEG